MDEEKQVTEEQEEQQKNENAGNVNEPEQKPKKRRTAEEIAADKLAREKKLNEDAEAAKVNISTWEKEIAEAQARIAEEKKKLKSNRNAIRTHKAMKLYGDLIAILGFDEEEKACATEADFDELAESVKNKVKDLLKKKKLR